MDLSKKQREEITRQYQFGLTEHGRIAITKNGDFRGFLAILQEIDAGRKRFFR
jgi:hypothetical protein